jgi:hypothetical protein
MSSAEGGTENVQLLEEKRMKQRADKEQKEMARKEKELQTMEQSMRELTFVRDFFQQSANFTQPLFTWIDMKQSLCQTLAPIYPYLTFF